MADKIEIGVDNVEVCKVVPGGREVPAEAGKA